jgi:DNA-binding MarR family transcriptional regulator
MNADAARRQHQARRLRDAIAALVRRFQLAERADVACCGMTIAQAATLETLRATGTVGLGDLGRALGISPSTLTRNLDRLASRGLVERVTDPEDRRAARVELTTAGHAAADQIEHTEHLFACDILDRLSAAGADHAVETLEQLLEAVRGATERCCPGAFDHLVTEISLARKD